MEMHARTGDVAMRLRHEARFETVANGDALHQTLVFDCLVASLHGVSTMPQAQLKLTRCVFRDGGFEWQADLFAHGVDIAEEGFEIVDLAQAIDLDIPGPVAGHGGGRWAPRAVGVCFAVDQIEFHLAGDDRRQVEFLETVDDALKHMARIDIARTAVEFIGAQHQLREIWAEPGGEGQAVRCRLAQAVGIAIGPDQAGFLDIHAGDVERQHGTGQEAGVFIDRPDVVAWQILAARHAGLVGEIDLHKFDLRVRGQERVAGANIGYTVIHDFSPDKV